MRLVRGFDRPPRASVQRRPVPGITRGGFGYGLVCEQICAGALRPVLAGRGNQEFPGRVQVMRIPSCLKHSPTENQVHVPWFADSEAYPQIHLGPHRTLTRSLLRRTLGSRDQGNRYRPAKPGDRIGIAHRAGCFVGQFGVDSPFEEPGTFSVPGQLDVRRSAPDPSFAWNYGHGSAVLGMGQGWR